MGRQAIDKKEIGREEEMEIWQGHYKTPDSAPLEPDPITRLDLRFAKLPIRPPISFNSPPAPTSPGPMPVTRFEGHHAQH